jgi:glycine cleavage system protein P-like pyridoxal-binding family
MLIEPTESETLDEIDMYVASGLLFTNLIHLQVL